ncbi:hypothetical protein ACLOJK_016527 [Asimina triloba]
MLECDINSRHRGLVFMTRPRAKAEAPGRGLGLSIATPNEAFASIPQGRPTSKALVGPCLSNEEMSRYVIRDVRADELGRVEMPEPRDRPLPAIGFGSPSPWAVESHVEMPEPPKDHAGFDSNLS